MEVICKLFFCSLEHVKSGPNFTLFFQEKKGNEFVKFYFSVDKKYAKSRFRKESGTCQINAFSWMIDLIYIDI